MGALILIFIIGLIFTKINCQTRPNIIFILADDLGWNDVGFHGSNQIPTPNIDALAYTGIILNNYYVTPVCTPSRSALMTGKYPIHTGLQHGVIHGSAPYGLSLNETLLPQYLRQKGYVTRAVGKWHLGMQHEVIFGDQPWGLGLSEKILPQYLKEKGYATRAVGKWHLGHFKHQYLPEARGFDSHYGYWVGHQDYYDHTAIENLGYWGYDMRRGMNITWSDYGSYSTDLFTKEAVKIIQQHDSEKPLFLYLAHLATHSANAYRPLQAPAETIAKFNYIKDKNRRIFAAMVSKLDDSVGSVVEALFNAGMLENSVIIFSTDNGGPAAGFNLNAASNWPLRGVKDTLWEGGVRGASFVWSPRLLQPKVSNTMMHITDWLPTILSLIDEERNVGIESSKKYSKSLSKIPGLDGLDLKSSLFGNQPSPRHEILLNIDNERKIASLRVKNWKLIKGRTWNGTYDKWFGPSGRDSSYNWDALYYSSTSKVLTFIQKPLPSQNKIEEIRSQANVDCNDSNEISVPDREQDVFLFDLDEDPCEKNNLATTELKILNLMEKRLQYYMGTVVPPRNKPADPRSNPKYWGYAWINWMDFI